MGSSVARLILLSMRIFILRSVIGLILLSMRKFVLMSVVVSIVLCAADHVLWSLIGRGLSSVAAPIVMSLVTISMLMMTMLTGSCSGIANVLSMVVVVLPDTPVLSIFPV